ncbi:hypothetical protein EXIGLDRAFT_840103 [Exidia glandulosa HHB12029]|uniref:Uncharacterized protein n=1 Tax=Exidia glandulosa HHB12029 TaxID=1314781 RepID=A0A165EMU0_EXIGL|nr:hypothetical protein EXIGLDRAFT_840103 [Exidia glandulosa HHB12029]
MTELSDRGPWKPHELRQTTHSASAYQQFHFPRSTSNAAMATARQIFHCPKRAGDVYKEPSTGNRQHIKSPTALPHALPAPAPASLSPHHSTPHHCYHGLHERSPRLSTDQQGVEHQIRSHRDARRWDQHTTLPTPLARLALDKEQAKGREGSYHCVAPLVRWADGHASYPPRRPARRYLDPREHRGWSSGEERC